MCPILLHYISLQNSTQRQNSLQQQQQQTNQQPQQKFPQQQSFQPNGNNSNSNELQGIVLQETDRYAGLSIAFNAHSIAPSMSIDAHQPNTLTTKPQGLLGNEFDSNFNSINTNNFTMNSGIDTSTSKWTNLCNVEHRNDRVLDSL